MRGKSPAGVMYTCDAFGMHYCNEELYDSELEVLSPHLRFYYDCLMKPNARSVLTALKKIDGLEYSTIATGHGPLLRYNLAEVVGRCALLAQLSGQTRAKPTCSQFLKSSQREDADTQTRLST